jgi:hypothetical protein
MLAVPASAQTDYEKFQFYNKCSLVSLAALLNEEAKKLGITEREIRNLAKSRLRSARIYDEESISTLIVAIEVSKKSPTYSTNIVFNIPVRTYWGEKGPAGTWTRGGWGMHEGNHNYILSTLPQYIDEFINLYLKVNQKDCK